VRERFCVLANQRFWFQPLNLENIIYLYHKVGIISHLSDHYWVCQGVATSTVSNGFDKPRGGAGLSKSVQLYATPNDKGVVRESLLPIMRK